MSLPKSSCVSLSLFVSILLLAGATQAQGYPSKPVRLIVPAPGATDVICRVVAEKLTASLGKPVVLETKGGAGTTIASELVMNSPPDGHTLLCGISAFVTAPHYFPVRYDPIKDFVPVALLVKVAHVLLVRADLQIGSVRELIDYARANPDKLSFGSSGLGSSNYLNAALFQRQAKVSMVHVPYKGGAEALQDLLGGRIDVLFDVPQGGIPFVRSGKLRALAVTTEERLAAFPEIPTMAEAGAPGYASSPWAGILAPANTPPDVVKRLNDATQQALKMPDVQERLKQMGLRVEGGSPNHFSVFLQQESGRWGPLIQDLKKDAK